MTIESRHHARRAKTGLTKASDLPRDYLKMVDEVFKANFDAGLRAIEKTSGTPTAFEARGAVFSDEVVLSVTLAQAGKITATTIYASMDFDPRASSPTVQDLLSACVDAAGTFFGNFLDGGSERTEQLLDQSASALENAPFDWTPVQIEKHQVFLKVDKSNPALDNLADEWLAKNDPNHKKQVQQEEREAEARIIVGKKTDPGNRNGPSNLH